MILIIGLWKYSTTWGDSRHSPCKNFDGWAIVYWNVRQPFSHYCRFYFHPTIILVRRRYLRRKHCCPRSVCLWLLGSLTRHMRWLADRPECATPAWRWIGCWAEHSVIKRSSAVGNNVTRQMTDRSNFTFILHRDFAIRHPPLTPFTTLEIS